MANIGTRLVEKTHAVLAQANILSYILPDTNTPAYVSLKGYNHLTAYVQVLNTETVTGGAITLKQATAVAGTSEKALAFDTMWANTNTATSDVLVSTAVVSSTFTPATTSNTSMLYVIEVDAESLDVDGGFDCVRVGAAAATAQLVNVLYVLSGQRYCGPTSSQLSAILD